LSYAGGVVDGLAEHLVTTGPRLQDDQAVPPGHQQGEQRPLEARLLEQRCEEVSFQVVDADERHAPRQGEGLGRGQSHEQRADEARTARHRDALDRWIVRVESGLGDGAPHHRPDRRHVRAPGEFGDHSAKCPVLVDRRLDHRGDDVEVVVDDRRGGLVTARLDSQHHRHANRVGRSL
jgi:hypothetical protein